MREARGDAAADRIAGLKKPDMVSAAEELLAGTGWLPEPLRMPHLPEPEDIAIELVEPDANPAANEGEAIGGERRRTGHGR